jgi:hypothetical protein
VRLIKGTLAWGGFEELRDQVARVVEFVDNGTLLQRISVRFPNDV